MKFEYQENVFDEQIPSLVIPVSEVSKAKAFKTDPKAFKELQLFQKCINIYTTYCGESMTIDRLEFIELCNKIGKSGSLIISYCVVNEYPEYLVRVISNDGEREIPVRFSRTFKIIR